jgi:hypothetical protein
MYSSYWLLALAGLCVLSQAKDSVVSRLGEVEPEDVGLTQDEAAPTIINTTTNDSTDSASAAASSEDFQGNLEAETPASFLDDPDINHQQQNENLAEDFDDEDDDYDYDDSDAPMTSPDDGSEQDTGEYTSGMDDASDFGVRQLYFRNYHTEILEAIELARSYIQEEIQVDPAYLPVRTLCVNKLPECAYWSAVGECDLNPSFMDTNCAPMCETCEMLHVSTRCPPPDPNATIVMYPGDLNRLFYRLLEDPAFANYTPTAYSRPDLAPGDTPETADYALGMWLVVLDNIVTEPEAKRMIELAHHRGYARSEDVGEELEDGTFGTDVNEDRTSTNAWCEDDCYDDPVAQKIMQSIEHVTGIPQLNQESLQQLKYEVGQFYNVHNDFIEYQVDRPGGPRIL